MPLAEPEHFTADQHQYQKKQFNTLADKQENAKNGLRNIRGLVWSGIIFLFLVPYWVGVFKIGQWFFNLLQ